MKGVTKAADKIREQRRPAAEDNPFVKFQETVSKNIVDALDKWRDTQEALSEALFLGIYGSPVVQAAVGITPDAEVSSKPQMSPEHRKRLEARIAELKSQVGSGGLRECVIRGLLYVGMSRGMVDERSLEALRRARAHDAGLALSRSRSSRRSCANNSSCCCSSRKRFCRHTRNCFQPVKRSGVPAWMQSAACCPRVQKYPARQPNGSIG